jgi:hypothetical protein
MWIALILVLLFALGCTRDRIVAPEEPDETVADDLRSGPPALIPEPQQQVNTWSELKRRYAGRPPKNDG